MDRRVSENSRQFESVMDLTELIAELWNSLDEKYVQGLYNSISDGPLHISYRKGCKKCTDDLCSNYELECLVWICSK